MKTAAEKTSEFMILQNGSQPKRLINNESKRRKGRRREREYMSHSTVDSYPYTCAYVRVILYKPRVYVEYLQKEQEKHSSRLQVTSKSY